MKKVEHVGALVQKRTLVRSKELKGLSVSRSHLWNLARAGKIEHVRRGLYRAKEAPISANETLLEVAKRVPLGVLCLSSALRFHELTTENPFKVWLAIERGAWSPKLDYPPVRVVHFSEAAFKFEIETHSVEGGNARL
jgi:predicted transcriptional regulator of viral defense system